MCFTIVRGGSGNVKGRKGFNNGIYVAKAYYILACCVCGKGGEWAEAGIKGWVLRGLQHVASQV